MGFFYRLNDRTHLTGAAPSALGVTESEHAAPVRRSAWFGGPDSLL
jgi:hypothetical protein